MAVTNGRVFSWTGGGPSVLQVPVRAQQGVVTIAASGHADSSSSSLRSMALGNLPNVPAAPTGLTISGKMPNPTLAWTAPSSDGGMPVTSYDIADEFGSISEHSLDLSRTFTVPYGQRHRFHVRAVNAVGPSPWTDFTAPFGAVLPEAPGPVTARPGYNWVDVSWVPPASDGGSPITGYRVTATNNSLVCTTTGKRGCRITGGAGTRVAFKVQATTAAGDSPWSAQSNIVTILHPPRPVQIYPFRVYAVRGSDRVAIEPGFEVPLGTRVIKAQVVAAQGGRVVASGRAIRLGPGRYKVTERVWFQMSNGVNSVVSRTQPVNVVRYVPPPPPPRPNIDCRNAELRKALNLIQIQYYDALIEDGKLEEHQILIDADRAEASGDAIGYAGALFRLEQLRKRMDNYRQRQQPYIAENNSLLRWCS